MTRKFWMQSKSRRDLRPGDILLSKMIDASVGDFSQYRKNAETAVVKLMATLRDSDLQIQMVKHVIVGSIGKRISLGSDYNPDVDILLLLRTSEADTLEKIDKYQTEIVKKVVKILKGNPTYKHLRSNKNAQKYGITVKVKVERDQYRKLDIVTGIHFEPSMESRAPQYFAQWETAMSLISSEASKGTDAQQGLCGSLVEISTFFTKCQPDFVIRFVRLVKLWCRNNISRNRECFNGQATVLELMAVKAASEQVKKSGGLIKKASSQINKSDPASYPSFTLALEGFLKIMKTKLNKIQIWFEADDYPAEKLRPVPEIVLRALKESRLKYKDSGMLLDPANPYHNFLADPTVKPVYEFYRRKAAESYNWLKKYLDRPKELDASILEGIINGTL